MLVGAELEILVWGGRIAYIYIYIYIFLVNYIFIYTFINQLHIDIFTRELLFKYCQTPNITYPQCSFFSFNIL